MYHVDFKLYKRIAPYQKRYSEFIKKGFPWFLVLFSLVTASEVYGDLGIAPQIKEIQISRGGWINFNLTVTNHSDDNMNLEMFADDMDVSEQGSAIIAGEDYERGCADWIEFSPEYFRIEAGSSQSVMVSVKAPKKVNGSYFAIMTCRAIKKHTLGVSSEGKITPGLEFGVRVGSLLLLKVRSSQNSVVLDPDTIKFEPGGANLLGPVAFSEKAEENHWKIEVPISNNGNIYTIISGDVSIYSELGRFISRAPLTAGRGFLFPERSRVFTAEGDRSLSDGPYLVRVNIRSREGKTKGASFPFTVINGAAFSGSESDEIRSLLKASSPGFNLQKRFLDFDIVPGSHRTKGVTISNYLQDTLALVPRFLNWIVDNDGNITLLSGGDSIRARSCASWLEVSPDTLVILPGRKKSAKVKIQAPDEIDGEYYAAVRFDAGESKDDLPTEFQLPSALLVAASAKQTLKPSAEIRSFESKPASSKGNLFEIKFENTGNVHCYASGRLELMDQRGENIGDPVVFGGESEFIFPGVIRNFSVPWPESLEPGRYRAYVTISYHEKTKSLRETIAFVID